MDEIKRFTHSERAERRKQLKQEFDQVVDVMGCEKTVEFLIDKYGLSKNYISKVVDASYKIVRKQRDQEILKAATDLSGKHTSKSIVNQLALKFDLCQYTIRQILKSNQFEFIPFVQSKKSSDKQEEVKKLILEGLTISEIAARLNNSRENIYRYYRRMLRSGEISAVNNKSYQKRERHEDILKTNSEEILKLSKSGNNIVDISKQFGIPENMISRLIRDNNMTRLSAEAYNAVKHSRRKWLSIIADLMNPNLSIGDIAIKYEKHQSNVSQFASDCKAMGIPLPERVDGRSRRHTLQSQKASSKASADNEASLNHIDCLGINTDITGINEFVDSTSTVLLVTI